MPRIRSLLGAFAPALLVAPLLVGPAAAARPAAAAARPAAAAARPAAAPSCMTLGVPIVNRALGIHAVAVHAVRPNARSLICSYYGASGRIANEATAIYLHGTAAQFAVVVSAARAAHHRLVPVPRLGEAAYAFAAPPNEQVDFLYRSTIVELYAAVPVVRVVALARAAIPRLAAALAA